MSNTNKQTVGAQIPDRLFRLINLCSLSKGQSKSQIIRDGLLLWIEQNDIDVQELIENIRLELQAKWLRNKNSDHPVPRYNWLESQKEVLEKHGLSDEVIKQIFKDFWS